MPVPGQFPTQPLKRLELEALSLDRLLSTMPLHGRTDTWTTIRSSRLGFLTSTLKAARLLLPSVCEAGLGGSSCQVSLTSGHHKSPVQFLEGSACHVVVHSVNVQPCYFHSPDAPQVCLVPRLFLLTCLSLTLPLPIYPFSGFPLPFLMSPLGSGRAEVFPGRKLLHRFKKGGSSRET